MSVKILIVDDHKIIREALISLIHNKTNYVVVGQARDSYEALRCLEKYDINVVIMDMTLYNSNGIDCTQEIVLHYPHIKVIILSMHAGLKMVTDALTAGAAGYITKGCAFEELYEAIDVVTKGEHYLCSCIPIDILDRNVYSPKTKQTKVDALSVLSFQERRVLQLLSNGMSNKDISTRLNKSIKAIEATRSRLMTKLNAKNVADLVRFAISCGLCEERSKIAEGVGAA